MEKGKQGLFKRKKKKEEIFKLKDLFLVCV